MYKHRLLVEVVIDGSEIKGVSIQGVAERKDDDPNKGMNHKQILERDISILVSGLISLIHSGHQMKVKDSAKSMEDIIEMLNEGFINPTAEIIDQEGYNEKTN